MLKDNTTNINYMLSDPEGYEKMLMAGLLRVESVWLKMKSWLCRTRDSDRYDNDFTDITYFAFYMVLLNARVMCANDEEGRFSVPSLAIMQCVLGALSTDKKLSRLMSRITGDELADLYNEFTGGASDEEIESVVAPTCLLWLKNRKLSNGLRDIELNGNDDPSSGLYRLQEDMEAISSVSEDEEFHALGDNDGNGCVERIELGSPFVKFERSLGGGLGKKEHIIVCAPTGQGKTIFACQLAAQVALSGSHVLFISTEQDHVETEPRFISCCSCRPPCAKIKYDLVKDGVDEAISKNGVLTQEQIDTIYKIRRDLAPFLHMVNWNGGDKTVVDIIQLTRRAKKKFGSIDLVILDWIGAALEGSETDPQKKRLLYQKAAEVMKILAVSENVATVSMAQTTRESVGVKLINESHLAECKSLHWQATAAYGISALRRKLTDEDLTDQDGQAVFETRQYMHAFKSRKAKGIVFPIDREFDFQRFDNL